MIELSASNFNDVICDLGTKAKGAYGIVSFSFGRRSFVLNQLIQQTVRAGRKHFRIDAQTNAGSPALFYKSFFPEVPNDIVQSNLTALLSTVQSSSNSIVIIDHAEHFLQLTHYLKRPLKKV